MGDIINFRNIHEYNVFNNNETLHPLVSIVDLDKAEPRQLRRLQYDFYTVFFKKIHCGDLRYGLNNYDYEEGTLIFLAPGQVIGENGDTYYQPQGTALVFHPDLLLGTSLGKKIRDYTFFSYAVNEALHLSEQERKIILDCFDKIRYELKHSIDKHTKQLIVSNIELFLNYCERFYDRQFITRDNVNKGVLEKFEESLNSYFASEKPYSVGLPSVAYFADELNLSSNYFGDLIKKETGKSAQEYIQNKIIDIAKDKIFDSNKTISEIAYELGFRYPQHFSRLFKQRVGYTPNEYRSLN
ncbi:transcriptional regulator, AraC family [Sphingobacterium spiritivorum ATCC 33300]|uniref:Transcriptional regulator, AraC family n=1 Tax=Sphingobacterium spiritivorum ATCC 33300 TaxID=525372 RepID=C2FT29_SPHSI|nr:helix-turn-helix domain-containing protein [Sphingobacterium spiritivorum]EEI93863.1 transcriptional regulator, AraC family [Sphingobacterium spiritivorum ATCC 33300]QQS94426.1 helix-turn-helix transcriptional regulator [Sphingobacterium spiritivorum]